MAHFLNSMFEKGVPMSLFVSLQLMFGLLFARRTLHQLVRGHLIEEKLSRQLFFGLALTFLLATFLFRAHPRLQFSAIAAGMILLLSIDKLFVYRLESRIHSEFPAFINQLILSMQTGQSFRSAAEKTLEGPKALWQRWLFALVESRVLLQARREQEVIKEDVFCQSYLAELIRVNENPHSSLTRLKSFRKKLKVLSEFRRKSGQALLQTRIQMVVMTFLYLALLVFTLSQRSFERNQTLIFVSITLFTSGQIVFWRLARKKKWKL
jgi:hypothetical protein